MNYTINEIPDTATEANNTDYAIMWQNKTKKISISNLFKKLVKKSEVTNTISPINENPVTSKAVSSLLTISASSTTITDAPPLQNGIPVKIFFTSEITGSDNTTVLQISYNGTTYNVKVPKDGALQNYVAFEVSSGVFKYLQAYTTLELLFDGTQFVIVGNPLVFSNSDYFIYTDGSVTFRDGFKTRINGASYTTLTTFFQELVLELKNFLNNKKETCTFAGVWTGKSYFTGLFYKYSSTETYGEIEFQNAQNNKFLYNFTSTGDNIIYYDMV